MTPKPQALRAFVDHPTTTRVITGLILLNAVTLGLETNDALVQNYGATLFFVDRLLLTIFSIELVAKGLAYRRDFVNSGWNWFDLIIITISWLPSTGALSVLRALRVLRVLRLLSVVPQMRRVISALGHSIPGMGSVVGVLLLVFYIAAVLATKLFGNHPDPNMQAWFGDLGASAYTLFQIMTLESWSMGIVRPTMEIFPLAWVFFLPFIIITSFAVLNLFIGIIVDAMQMVQQEERSHEPGLHTVTTEIAALREEIRALKDTLKARDGRL